jgi:hypothetical protein
VFAFRITVLVALIAWLAVGAATAKDFKPGDLRVCNAVKCAAIFDRGALNAFSAFYYGSASVERAAAPPSGASAFRLKLNGAIVGVAATRRLDRVLAYGLNCGRFERGVWYRLPARAAIGLRRLTAGLVPQRVPRGIPRSC